MINVLVVHEIPPIVSGPTSNSHHLYYSKTRHCRKQSPSCQEVKTSWLHCSCKAWPRSWTSVCRLSGQSAGDLNLRLSNLKSKAWKECEIKESRLIIHYLTRSQIVCKFKVVGELEREVLVKVEDILQAFTCYVINVTIRQSSYVTISTLCRSFAWDVLAKKISFPWNKEEAVFLSHAITERETRVSLSGNGMSKSCRVLGESSYERIYAIL